MVGAPVPGCGRRRVGRSRDSVRVGLGDVPTTTLSLREELGLALRGKSEIEPRRRGAVPGTPPPARSAARQIASCWAPLLRAARCGAVGSSAVPSALSSWLRAVSSWLRAAAPVAAPVTAPVAAPASSAIR